MRVSVDFFRHAGQLAAAARAVDGLRDGNARARGVAAALRAENVALRTALHRARAELAQTAEAARLRAAGDVLQLRTALQAERLARKHGAGGAAKKKKTNKKGPTKRSKGGDRADEEARRKERREKHAAASPSRSTGGRAGADSDDGDDGGGSDAGGGAPATVAELAAETRRALLAVDRASAARGATMGGVYRRFLRDESEAGHRLRVERNADKGGRGNRWNR